MHDKVYLFSNVYIIKDAYFLAINIKRYIERGLNINSTLLNIVPCIILIPPSAVYSICSAFIKSR